mmetsp:Transcript_88268/g.265707  ORF Transcript_88268/g.265707 Transcript_88268/m.265707 type:complete len:350 (-) Transcript_88268:88-1137(-)
MHGSHASDALHTRATRTTRTTHPTLWCIRVAHTCTLTVSSRTHSPQLSFTSRQRGRSRHVIRSIPHDIKWCLLKEGMPQRRLPLSGPDLGIDLLYSLPNGDKLLGRVAHVPRLEGQFFLQAPELFPLKQFRVFLPQMRQLRFIKFGRAWSSRHQIHSAVHHLGLKLILAGVCFVWNRDILQREDLGDLRFGGCHGCSIRLFLDSLCFRRLRNFRLLLRNFRLLDEVELMVDTPLREEAHGHAEAHKQPAFVVVALSRCPPRQLRLLNLLEIEHRLADRHAYAPEIARRDHRLPHGGAGHGPCFDICLDVRKEGTDLRGCEVKVQFELAHTLLRSLCLLRPCLRCRHPCR